MKKRSVIVTILFLIYLVVVFTVFFNDKKMIAVFSSIGAAIYAANIKQNIVLSFLFFICLKAVFAFISRFRGVIL